ncbi:MAG: acyl-CoA thioesterase [Betaproteobacteria bacterium]|nr:acyl-CoA thioesterase [Betaproteobacteria bacterium]
MHDTRKLLHVERIPLRWGDMDAFGHVNNTVYFRYMEQARIGWLEAIGIDMNAPTEGPVIINASCTFLKQLVYPGVLEVKMHGGAPGKSSVMSYYEIRVEGDDTLYAEGAAKVVWVDHSLGKSCPIPDWVRKHLG